MLKCPICRLSVIETRGNNAETLVICPLCGNYKANENFLMSMGDFIGEKHRHLISGYVRRKSDKRETIFIGGEDKCNQIISLLPESYSFFEVIDFILLKMYATQIENFDEVSSFGWNDYPLFFLKSFEELTYCCKIAVNELGFLNGDFDSNNVHISLSNKGWKRVEELKNQSLDSNKVFIAMAFGDKTKEFREVLKNVIAKTGYQSIIVDEEHYTGNIMDYILTQIKEAKFVISDFTFSPEKIEKAKVKDGVRGGVYYEAGFAKGLGLQVIHTCKNDKESKQRIHFDINQENTIFWNDDDLKKTEIRSDIERQRGNSAPQNFSEQLYDRIKFIFGLGKNIPE